MPQEQVSLHTTSRNQKANSTTIVLVGVLILEFLVSSLYGFWFKTELVQRPENPRWAIADRFVPLGDIVDRNGQLIVTSKGDIGEITRSSLYPALSPIVGYTNSVYGQTGLEAAMYPTLRGLVVDRDLQAAFQEWTTNQPPVGLNVRLTLDLSLQQMADDLLGDERGAAILMNAETGEILTMASHPYFNPDTLAEDWDTFSDDENGPLVNRVTQGSYPVGGTLFPFILADQINIIDTFPRPESVLSSLSAGPGCAMPPTSLDWASIVTYGCVNAQADLAAYTGLSPVLSLIQRLGLYTSPNLRLTVAEAAQSGVTDERAYFKGENLMVSPLQIAIAASALSNEGSLVAPRIVIGYQNLEENWVTLPKLSSGSTALTPTQANQLSTLLEIGSEPQWQVTSSTETEEGDPLTWFVAGSSANWQGQAYVVVVALEADQPDLAAHVGLSLLDRAMNLPTEN
jgi:peptidoglycan glycosyltransferase